MRKVTFGGACSLDNFIARPDGAVDWLLWTPEVAAISKESLRTVDTLVMGRKTYEAAVREGMTSYPGGKNYVVSNTLRQAPDPAVEVVAGDGVDFVRGLKAEEGGDICILGGGILAHGLLAADLIDEIGLNIHPVLLGEGVPLFHGLHRQLDLELREHKVLSNGCVYVLYRVVRAGLTSGG